MKKKKKKGEKKNGCLNSKENYEYTSIERESDSSKSVRIL